MSAKNFGGLLVGLLSLSLNGIAAGGPLVKGSGAHMGVHHGTNGGTAAGAHGTIAAPAGTTTTSTTAANKQATTTVTNPAGITTAYILGDKQITNPP